MGIRLLRIVSFALCVATVVVGVMTLASPDGALGGLAVSLGALATGLSALTILLIRRHRRDQAE